MVQQGTTTNPNYTTTTASSCPNMLPCGVFRLLMMNCPKQTIQYTPIWQQTISPTCINESENE